MLAVLSLIRRWVITVAAAIAVPWLINITIFLWFADIVVVNNLPTGVSPVMAEALGETNTFWINYLLQHWNILTTAVWSGWWLCAGVVGASWIGYTTWVSHRVRLATTLFGVGVVTSALAHLWGTTVGTVMGLVNFKVATVWSAVTVAQKAKLWIWAYTKTAPWGVLGGVPPSDLSGADTLAHALAAGLAARAAKPAANAWWSYFTEHPVTVVLTVVTIVWVVWFTKTVFGSSSNGSGSNNDTVTTLVVSTATGVDVTLVNELRNLITATASELASLAAKVVAQNVVIAELTNLVKKTAETFLSSKELSETVNAVVEKKVETLDAKTSKMITDVEVTLKDRIETVENRTVYLRDRSRMTIEVERMLRDKLRHLESLINNSVVPQTANPTALIDQEIARARATATQEFHAIKDSLTKTLDEHMDKSEKNLDEMVKAIFKSMREWLDENLANLRTELNDLKGAAREFSKKQSVTATTVESLYESLYKQVQAQEVRNLVNENKIEAGKKSIDDLLKSIKEHLSLIDQLELRFTERLDQTNKVVNVNTFLLESSLRSEPGQSNVTPLPDDLFVIETQRREAAELRKLKQTLLVADEDEKARRGLDAIVEGNRRKLVKVQEDQTRRIQFEAEVQRRNAVVDPLTGLTGLSVPGEMDKRMLVDKEEMQRRMSAIKEETEKKQAYLKEENDQQILAANKRIDAEESLAATRAQEMNQQPGPRSRADTSYSANVRAKNSAVGSWTDRFFPASTDDGKSPALSDSLRTRHKKK